MPRKIFQKQEFTTFTGWIVNMMQSQFLIRLSVEATSSRSNPHDNLCRRKGVKVLIQGLLLVE